MSTQNISILTHNDCCGCRSCGDICPKECISFTIDNEGFYYPNIALDKCINCGLCQRVCPELNDSFNDEPKESYAAYAKDKESRINGSSGGIFGVLSRNVITSGGSVWGAAFDEKLQLHHTKADSIDALSALYKSKYIQSDLTGVYKKIKDDVRRGVLTLFCGTPCQCNALKNFLGKDYANLIVVDFVCHGVPSQDLFNKSIQSYETDKGVKVIFFQFRYKDSDSKHPQSYRIDYYKNGKQHNEIGLHYQFPYYFGFQKYITLRESCYTCKWANKKRTGDITVGDFWGIEKLKPELDTKKGVSMVFSNTPKGEQLLITIFQSREIFFEPVSYEFAIENNGALQGPTLRKQERDEFFADLQIMSFHNVISKHLIPKRKIVFDMYYAAPLVIRRIIRRIMNKNMKYE